jgi:hypothetical protein
MNGGGDPGRRARLAAYALLAALAAGHLAGRILAVNSVNRIELEQYLVGQRMADFERQLRSQGLGDERIDAAVEEARPRIEASERRQRPFLSANDRSRWLTIRALVDEGTFAIDGVMDERVWNTIDMVQHAGRDGRKHLYSSKPPLLSVLLAGGYWVVRAVTGWTLGEQPFEVVRLMLLLVNVPAMLLILALVCRWAERFGTTDFGRMFVAATAALGTLLTPFAVVLNNHLIAAASAAIALDALLRIGFDGERRLRWFALAGGFAAFAAADDLPALSLLALASTALMAIDRRAWLLGFLPAAAVVVAAFFGTNYAAHASWKPPYAHRSATDAADNWYDYTYTLGGRERASYWRDPQGLDAGEPSRAIYALHVLVGHHGLLSLTPAWLLSVWGAWLWLRGGDGRLRLVAAGVALLTAVCLAFYIGVLPQRDRNYGGLTCGFRWLLWQAPLWLLVMLPAADRAASSRRGMIAACLLLACSALSASYPTWNPWTQPWIYNWLNS